MMFIFMNAAITLLFLVVLENSQQKIINFLIILANKNLIIRFRETRHHRCKVYYKFLNVVGALGARTCFNNIIEYTEF